jgi:ADP-ribose pyrophosphatase YjhB (NUDIX family)
LRIVNDPLEYCPYCGAELEVIEWPKHYRCDACERPVYHNAVLGGGVVVVDGDSVLLVEDSRIPGAWTLPEGRPEIPESPREGVARELEEEAGLSVDPADLVYLYDSAAEPVEEKYMMGIYYAVERAATAGRVAAGMDAVDARFWTPAEFVASDQRVKNKYENPFWFDDLDLLLDVAEQAFRREQRYATVLAPHTDAA